MAGQALEYIADSGISHENENNSFAESYVEFVDSFRQNFNYGKVPENTKNSVVCTAGGGLLLYLKGALGTSGAVASAYSICGKIALAAGGIFGLIAAMGFLYSARKNKKKKAEN